MTFKKEFQGKKNVEYLKTLQFSIWCHIVYLRVNFHNLEELRNIYRPIQSI